jgi:transcriptional regulator with XRE-family HTH domain
MMHDMPNPTTVASAIRRARGSRSQAEIADALGVDQSTVARWENGSTAIPHTRLADLLGVLGITWADLDAEPTPEPVA